MKTCLSVFVPSILLLVVDAFVVGPILHNKARGDEPLAAAREPVASTAPDTAEEKQDRPAKSLTRTAIPEENLEIPDDLKACAAQLQRIYAAIKKYEEDKGCKPDWLSGLVPDYLDKSALVCRDNGREESPFWRDPKPPCNFVYEFSPTRLSSFWGPLAGMECRDWKVHQVKYFGNVVPLVRCAHESRILNVSVGGRVYWSDGKWEILFRPDYRYGDELPPERPLPNGWVFQKPDNLGPTVNSRFWESDPALSADGLTLVFSSDRPGGQGGADLWVCNRALSAEPFGKPVNLGPTVNSTHRDSGPTLSTDGLNLYFTSNRSGQGSVKELWMCTRSSLTGPFGKAIRLAVSKKGMHPGQPALSADELTIFFNSDRLPGHGLDDLWKCTRAAIDEPFGEPVNLGSIVNGSVPDCGPTLSSDGRTLLFYSQIQSRHRHWDLMMCTRPSSNEPFGKPVNLGPGVNSGGRESSPELSADGQTLIFCSDRPGGQGGDDLWMARIEQRKISGREPGMPRRSQAETPEDFRAPFVENARLRDFIARPASQRDEASRPSLLSEMRNLVQRSGRLPGGGLGGSGRQTQQPRPPAELAERILSKNVRSHFVALMELGLAQVPNLELASLLIKEVDNEDWETSFKARKGLVFACRGDPAPVIAALKDGEPGIRSEAAGILGWMVSDDWVGSDHAPPGAEDFELTAESRALAFTALKSALPDPDADVRASVALALAEFADTRALPPLETLAKEESQAHVKLAITCAIQQLQKQVRIEPFAEALKDPDRKIRQAACRCLGRLCLDGAGKLLIPLLNDEEKTVRIAAAGALREIKDPHALPVLLSKLEDSEPEVRHAVLHAVDEIATAETEPTLTKILVDEPNAWLRSHAASALDDIAGQHALQAIAQCFASPSEDTRFIAEIAFIGFLGEMKDRELVPGVHAPMAQILVRGFLEDSLDARQIATIGHPAIASALAVVLGDRNHAERARVNAVSALGLMVSRGVKPSEVFEALLAAAKEPNERIRDKALEALVHFPEEERALEGRRQAAAETSETLVRQLSDSDSALRCKAAVALGKTRDPSVVPALTRALGDESPNVRAAAAESLGSLHAEQAAVPLAQRLKDQQTASSWKPGEGPTAVAEVAVDALRKITDKTAAVPVLLELLGDSSSDVRQRAASLMRSIKDERCLPALKQALGDADSHVRYSAVQALASIGGTEAAQALAGIMDADDEELRNAAYTALGNLGGEEAVDILRQALETGDTKKRLAATWALGFTGHPQAVEPLVRALQSPDKEFRTAAAQALGHIGSCKGLPGLMEALQDSDPSVRVTAAHAVALLGDAACVPAALQAIEEGQKEQDYDHVEEAVAALVFASINGFDCGEARESLQALARSPIKHKRLSAWGLSFIAEDASAAAPILAGVANTDERSPFHLSGPRYLTHYARRGIEDEAARKCLREAILAGKKYASFAVKPLGALGEKKLLESIVAASAPKSAGPVFEDAPDMPGNVIAYHGGRQAARGVLKDAADALAEAGDEQSVPVLRGLLDNDDLKVRVAAAAALAQLGDDSGFDALIEGIRDTYWETASTAARGLGLLGNPSAIAELRAAFRSERNWSNPNRDIAIALRRLGDSDLQERLQAFRGVTSERELGGYVQAPPYCMFDEDYECGVLLMAMGDEEAAVETLHQAARRQERRIALCRESSPCLPYLCHILAGTYLAMDTKLDEAVDLAQRATELKPSEALFLATLSRLHEKKGAHGEAREAIKKALDLRPYHEVFKNRLAALEKKEG